MSNKSLNNYYEFKILHKFWAIFGYEDDHMNVLNEREDNRFEISFKSQQIHSRSTLVKLIKEIGVLKQLDQLSIHLAVYILDVFMDRNSIKFDGLNLVALAALLLATKFEERDSQMLKTSELNMFSKNDYLLGDYYSMEILILECLTWNINIPTVVQFVDVYLEYIISAEEMADMCRLRSSADIWSDVSYYVKKYMDCVIDDITLMHEKPSKVAAAIIACTRANLKFTSIYPSHLFTISKYRLFELKILMGRLKNGVPDINCDE